MSFSSSSTNITLSDDGHTLKAYCGDGRGGMPYSEFDLDTKIGNSFGNFDYGSNFSRSARKAWLVTDDDDGVHLVALLGDGNGGYNLSQMRLDVCIGNIWGKLTFCKPPKPPRDMEAEMLRLMEVMADNHGGMGGESGKYGFLFQLAAGLVDKSLRFTLEKGGFREVSDRVRRDNHTKLVLALVWKGYPNHTIVVIHPRCKKSSGWSHVGYSFREDQDGRSIKYYINVCPHSKKGETLVNEGDGGYVNWAIRGWFDKNNSTIKTK